MPGCQLAGWIRVWGVVRRWWAGIGALDVTDLEDKSIGTQIFGGYGFQYIDLEGGYMKLGEFEDSATYDDIPLKIKTDTEGLVVRMNSRIPVSDTVDFTISAGGIDYEGTLKACAEGFCVSTDESDFEWMYGLGLEFKASDTISWCARWERVDLEDADLDMFSVDLLYKF